MQTETDDGIVVPCIIGRQSIESTDSLRSQVPPQVIAARRSTESLTAVGTAYAPDCGECADLVRQPRSGVYLRYTRSQMRAARWPPRTETLCFRTPG